MWFGSPIPFLIVFVVVSSAFVPDDPELEAHLNNGIAPTRSLGFIPYYNTEKVVLNFMDRMERCMYMKYPNALSSLFAPGFSLQACDRKMNRERVIDWIRSKRPNLRKVRFANVTDESITFHVICHELTGPGKYIELVLDLEYFQLQSGRIHGCDLSGN
ncbi:hypothetical protein CRE_18250 [Caenorhabditis remanei]|uniref:NTF2-like domain-containing protein n=1 Tax=Caenorhabditis remanei TaxID=31234 RepID=E3NFI0_CAERE|nr:hypothetical protein CRE_18250 [Caenorhabditis remanei]